MRLGGVMPATVFGSLMASLLGWTGLVKVDQIAKVFVDVAINGAKKTTLENADIVKY
jgi:hypothetical protein